MEKRREEEEEWQREIREEWKGGRIGMEDNEGGEE